MLHYWLAFKNEKKNIFTTGVDADCLLCMCCGSLQIICSAGVRKNSALVRSWGICPENRLISRLRPRYACYLPWRKCSLFHAKRTFSFNNKAHVVMKFGTDSIFIYFVTFMLRYLNFVMRLLWSVFESGAAFESGIQNKYSHVREANQPLSVQPTTLLLMGWSKKSEKIWYETWDKTLNAWHCRSNKLAKFVSSSGTLGFLKSDMDAWWYEAGTFHRILIFYLINWTRYHHHFFLVSFRSKCENLIRADEAVDDDGGVGGLNHQKQEFFRVIGGPKDKKPFPSCAFDHLK